MVQKALEARCNTAYSGLDRNIAHMSPLDFVAKFNDLLTVIQSG